MQPLLSVPPSTLRPPLPQSTSDYAVTAARPAQVETSAPHPPQTQLNRTVAGATTQAVDQAVVCSVDASPMQQTTSGRAQRKARWRRSMTPQRPQNGRWVDCGM